MSCALEKKSCGVLRSRLSWCVIIVKVDCLKPSAVLPFDVTVRESPLQLESEEHMPSFEYEKLIMDIPDYPKPGVVFKDITPLLADADGFAAVVNGLADPFRDAGITKVLGPEARGFMIGAPVAHELGVGFVPARKPGKLPREVVSQEYDLEYGNAALQMHSDALTPEDNVLIVDDLIATGGTMVAQVKLIEKLGANLVGISCLMELEYFHPRDILAAVTDIHLHSLVKVP